MATPERRTTSTRTPAVPTAPTATGPVPVMGPFGWVVILSAGIGLILATWLLYGTEYDGMWAGYRDGVIATVVLLCAMALNTSLPKKPFLGLIGLAGILLVLFAVFLDDETKIFVSELVSGVAMIAGAGLYATGRH